MRQHLQTQLFPDLPLKTQGKILTLFYFAPGKLPKPSLMHTLRAPAEQDPSLIVLDNGDGDMNRWHDHVADIG